MGRRLRVAGINSSTGTNGPWRRVVTHFQGCSLGCKGCFNKQLWPQREQVTEWGPVSLAEKLLSMGVHFTFSGGEPFEQGLGFLKLLHTLRDRRHSCTILVFTGHTLTELDRMLGMEIERTLSCIDVLVAGRYEEDKALPRPDMFRSSSNQVTLPLSRRIPLKVLQASTPSVEILTNKDGTGIITGFPDKATIQSFERNLVVQ